MLTITTRLTLWFLLSFGAIIVVMALVMYLAYAANERATLDGELRDYAEFLMAEVHSNVSDTPDLFDELQDVTSQANIRFRTMRFMLATEDSIFYESTTQQPVERLVDTLQEILPIWVGAPFRTIVVEGNEYRIFSLAVRRQRNESIELVVAASVVRLQQSLARLRNIFLVIVPLSWLIAGVGGWFMARRALQPVDEITSTAERISSRNLHERVPEGTSNDELAKLARTFNGMIARIEETFAAQRRFVADASHDLRTPLMVVQVHLDRLLRARDLQPDVQADLRQCAGEVDRLSHLAGDLLLLARADAHRLRLHRVPERLDEILLECVGRMKTLAAERAISLWVDIEEPVDILCDPSLLERALLNLLDNAVIHSLDSGVVRARLDRSDAVAVIRISNDGPGIPQEDIAKVFDRFYRSDHTRTTPGAGLGLAIAKTVVEAHDGMIAIESDRTAGTIVTIALPIDKSLERKHMS